MTHTADFKSKLQQYLEARKAQAARAAARLRAGAERIALEPVLAAPGLVAFNGTARILPPVPGNPMFSRRTGAIYARRGMDRATFEAAKRYRRKGAAWHRGGRKKPHRVASLPEAA